MGRSLRGSATNVQIKSINGEAFSDEDFFTIDEFDSESYGRWGKSKFPISHNEFEVCTPRHRALSAALTSLEKIHITLTKQ